MATSNEEVPPKFWTQEELDRDPTLGWSVGDYLDGSRIIAKLGAAGAPETEARRISLLERNVEIWRSRLREVMADADWLRTRARSQGVSMPQRKRNNFGYLMSEREVMEEAANA